MIRECFVPRQGHVYCSTDYNMLELCGLAQVTFDWFGHSAMREAINAGQDLHLRVAARILGITYNEAKSRKGELVVKNARQSSKPLNFGLPGLMGPAKIVFTARKDGVRFCELAGVLAKCGSNGKVTEWNKRTISPSCVECLHIAKRYSDIWFQEFPEVKEYHAKTVAMAREGDNGIPLVSAGNGMKRLETSPNAVSNHYFQNISAQGAKHAAWLLSKESYTDENSCLYNNARIVVFVHDEAITELREEVAHECAYRQAEIMIAGMREFLPDVRVSAVPAIARRWFKSMEEVKGKDGRIKPWWPGPSKWPWPADQEIMAKDMAEYAPKAV